MPERGCVNSYFRDMLLTVTSLDLREPSSLHGALERVVGPVWA